MLYHLLWKETEVQEVLFVLQTLLKEELKDNIMNTIHYHINLHDRSYLHSFCYIFYNKLVIYSICYKIIRKYSYHFLDFDLGIYF
jgi:hypothetical protein